MTIAGCSGYVHRDDSPPGAWGDPPVRFRTNRGAGTGIKTGCCWNGSKTCFGGWRGQSNVPFGSKKSTWENLHWRGSFWFSFRKKISATDKKNFFLKKKRDVWTEEKIVPERRNDRTTEGRHMGKKKKKLTRRRVVCGGMAGRRIIERVRRSSSDGHGEAYEGP